MTENFRWSCLCLQTLKGALGFVTRRPVKRLPALCASFSDAYSELHLFSVRPSALRAPKASEFCPVCSEPAPNAFGARQGRGCGKHKRSPGQPCTFQDTGTPKAPTPHPDTQPAAAPGRAPPPDAARFEGTAATLILRRPHPSAPERAAQTKPPCPPVPPRSPRSGLSGGPPTPCLLGGRRTGPAAGWQLAAAQRPQRQRAGQGAPCQPWCPAQSSGAGGAARDTPLPRSPPRPPVVPLPGAPLLSREQPGRGSPTLRAGEPGPQPGVPPRAAAPPLLPPGAVPRLGLLLRGNRGGAGGGRAVPTHLLKSRISLRRAGVDMIAAKKRVRASAPPPPSATRTNNPQWRLPPRGRGRGRRGAGSRQREGAARTGTGTAGGGGWDRDRDSGRGAAGTGTQAARGLRWAQRTETVSHQHNGKWRE